ncbi:hypothetical protein [Paenibacillus hubeiensis]|uniref:hypothetical protein n=1 Tax=Paenibacillus hubeiensis TaxID=3077330 RepID=UPI0031B9DB17
MRKHKLWRAAMILWTVLVILLGAEISSTEVTFAFEQGGVDQETADRLAEKYGLTQDTGTSPSAMSVDWGISFGDELVSLGGAVSMVRAFTHPMVFLVRMWL